MSSFTESVVEEAALSWFGELGYFNSACIEINHKNIWCDCGVIDSQIDAYHHWTSRSLAEESFRDQRLEFKEAQTRLDNRKLNEYCVAIANEPRPSRR